MTSKKTAELAHHPVADLFPMMAADELADLAADIAERGLLMPVVLDGEGRILDGRNRHAACLQAGVEPAFETYDGDDPAGYALAVNIARRHLTKGQQAMIAAKACKVSLQSTRKVAAQIGTSAQRVTQANVVLDYAPDLAEAVITGAEGLDAAYAEARERKNKAEGAEAQLARLRAEDPELADKVVEGDLSLPGAWAERRERVKQEIAAREQGRSAASRLLPDLKTNVTSVLRAAELGEPNLASPEMIADIRDAADLLERVLKEEF